MSGSTSGIINGRHGGPLPPPFGIVLLPGGRFEVSEVSGFVYGRGVGCVMPIRHAG